MNKFYLERSLFFLVLLPLICFAENTLTGTILDDEGLPLYGATVVVKGSNDGTVNDSQGQYTFTTQSNFPLTLEVSFVGFDTLSFSLSDDQPQRFQLSFSNRFDEIIVSASRKAEKTQKQTCRTMHKD